VEERCIYRERIMDRAGGKTLPYSYSHLVDLHSPGQYGSKSCFSASVLLNERGFAIAICNENPGRLRGGDDIKK